MEIYQKIYTVGDRLKLLKIKVYAWSYIDKNVTIYSKNIEGTFTTTMELDPQVQIQMISTRLRQYSKIEGENVMQREEEKVHLMCPCKKLPQQMLSLLGNLIKILIIYSNILTIMSYKEKKNKN